MELNKKVPFLSLLITALENYVQYSTKKNTGELSKYEESIFESERTLPEEWVNLFLDDLFVSVIICSSFKLSHSPQVGHLPYHFGES